jgi:hypothetical protein
MLLHIATGSSVRRTGVGTQVLEAVMRLRPAGVAETDWDAVGFYVADGFVATSLGEKYPGVNGLEFTTACETADRVADHGLAPASPVPAVKTDCPARSSRPDVGLSDASSPATTANRRIAGWRGRGRSTRSRLEGGNLS